MRSDLHQEGIPIWFDLMTDDIESARQFYGALRSRRGR